MKSSKFKLKKLKKKDKKLVSKPKIKLPKYDATKAVMQGLPQKASLVSEGSTGHFKEEYIGEKKWLS